MTVNTKSLITLTLLALVDVVIPIPVTGLILIYVILQQPVWFMGIVQEVYRSK